MSTELTLTARRSLHRRLRPLTISIALLGFMLWVPVEKLFMTEIGFDAASIGVMAAAYAALVPLVEIPSGILADRWSRRGVLVVAAVALTLTALIGGLSNNVPVYIASMLILAVYFAMYSGTLDAIVYDTVLEEIGASEAFEQQIGRVRLVESLALLSGGLAGGVLAELTSPRLTYFLTVPFAALAVLALLRFVEPQLHKAQGAVPLRAQISATVGAMTRTPRLLPIVILALLGAVLLQSIFEFGPLWLIAHDAAPGLYGPYWAALMATMGLGGLLAGRIPLHKPVVAAIVAAVMVLASVSLMFGQLPIVIAGQVLLALLLLIASIRATQLMHDSVPSTVRTGVASGVSAIGWMCFFPFALGFGFLSQSRGPEVAAWMLVAATILACIALVVVGRRQPSPAESGAEALTTRLLRDVRRCLLERRHEIDALDCNQVVELVTEFLEGDLDPHSELRFTNHIHGCLGCARYLDQVRQTIKELRGLSDQERLSVPTRATLLAAFRDSVSQPHPGDD